AALAEAAHSAATWISPYNDGQVIAGQGSLAIELVAQLQRFSGFDLEAATWLVPAGGGGLLSGIACALQSQALRPRLIGVQTESSPFLHHLYHDGSQDGVKELPTIADGLAGPVEPGAITIPIIQQLVDDLILVSEPEVHQAVAYAWHQYGQRIEGSAATGLAAVLRGKVKERPVVLVITGGNIQEQVWQGIIAHHPALGQEGG
ncbi:MAG: pyridoxal-phosphate dependent enzyme, partial [Anaerolineales bacterium]|nr:pyridoxal-phosphate dependent enzyme [Anaerolineales bacterium]